MTPFEVIEKQAKENLRGTTPENPFAPAAFVLGDNEIKEIIVFELKDDEAKEKVFTEIGKHLSEAGCHEVILVLDSWVRILDDPDEGEYVSKNWDTERPSTYPEDMRKNSLNLFHVNFTGTDLMKIVLYEKVSEGGVKIIEEKQSEGRMGGTIKESLTYGFLTAEAMKRFALGDTDPEAVAKSLREKYPNLEGSEDG